MTHDRYDGTWSSNDEDDPDIRVARPPLAWLIAGLAVALGGGFLGWLAPKVLVAALGWVLAGPVAFGLLAIFQNRDLRARSGGIYAEPGWLKFGYWLAVGLAVIAVTACAWRLADYIGRQW